MDESGLREREKKCASARVALFSLLFSPRSASHLVQLGGGQLPGLVLDLVL
jgi:hypothetical protein